MERITTSKKLELNIKAKSINKTWLAKELEMGRPTLYARLKDNFWEPKHLIKLKSLGLI